MTGKGRAIAYSPAELEWIESRREMPRRVLHAEFVVAFARDDVAFENFKALCTRKGWTTGRTGQFKQGSVPANKGMKMPFNANSARTRFKPGVRQGRAARLYKPIGTERISKDGYRERKIHDGLPLQSRWRAVHLIEWEALNGPVPAGHCLKCRDGNRRNTAPANWQAIPRALLPTLNGRWNSLPYDQAPDEVRPAILTMARLKNKAAKVRRRAGA